MPKTVWIDVEDLFEFAVRNSRPTGIQRLAYELYRRFHSTFSDSGQVRFLRIDFVRNTFYTVDWLAIESLFMGLSEGKETEKEPERSSSDELRLHSAFRLLVKRTLHKLPLEVRHRLIDTIQLQIKALQAFIDLCSFVVRRLWRRTLLILRSVGRRIKGGQDTLPVNDDFAQLAQPGDIVLAMGANWAHPNYAKLIEAARSRFGIEFGLLVYDVIPIFCPEWCPQELRPVFGAWLSSILPSADRIFAISQHTADDLVRFAAQSGIRLRSAPHVIPIGTGFESRTPAIRIDDDKPPIPGGYVLFVSTIEARKNHQLLLRVWRRLLEDKPASEVPTLVFAGRVGWLTSDLMAQLTNADYLQGKIIVKSNLSDVALEKLYRGCLFTVFPSYYEGWGLPVGESLAFGKPCLASCRTSIPEVGGRFCRYFDPDNVTEAYTIIRGLIEHPDDLAAWEADIRENFRPTTWETAARVMLTKLGLLAPDPPAIHPA